MQKIVRLEQIIRFNHYELAKISWQTMLCLYKNFSNSLQILSQQCIIEPQSGAYFFSTTSCIILLICQACYRCFAVARYAEKLILMIRHFPYILPFCRENTMQQALVQRIARKNVNKKTRPYIQVCLNKLDVTQHCHFVF